tara:strand:+ start:373 stop:618 length:246 start_codon:yes stop_codon:yes gene_type:complete
MFEYQLVNGYLRKDGTSVDAHLRGEPNGIEFDNLSYDPEIGINSSDFLDKKDFGDSLDENKLDFDSNESSFGDSFDFDFSA